MHLAPMPFLTLNRVPMLPGVRGVRQTLRAMRAMVNEARASAVIRQTAIGLIWLEPEREPLHEVAAIFDFVRDRIRYVRDVLDVETLSTPEKTLAQRIGDCDDQATLLAALLESVGYPTRFVVAAYTLRDQFEHVYLQVEIDGVWLDADPTEKEPLGYAPPDPLSLRIEGSV